MDPQRHEWKLRRLADRRNDVARALYQLLCSGAMHDLCTRVDTGGPISVTPPKNVRDLYSASLDILNCDGNAVEKAARSALFAIMWWSGQLDAVQSPSRPLPPRPIDVCSDGTFKVCDCKIDRGTATAREPAASESYDYLQDAPSRPPEVKMLGKGEFANTKGISRKVVAIHGLAHAESYAIDLAWDLVARFGFERAEGRSTPASDDGLAATGRYDCRGREAPPTDTSAPSSTCRGTSAGQAEEASASSSGAGAGQAEDASASSSGAGAGQAEAALSTGSEPPPPHVGAVRQCMPTEFLDDWVQVGAEETMHFQGWAESLRRRGHEYGCMAATPTLWDAAGGSRGSLAARLVAVHMTHEARGLDVFPGMHGRLSRSQAPSDKADADMLKRNATDEVGHVGAGVKWFKWTFEHGDRGHEAHDLKALGAESVAIGESSLGAGSAGVVAGDKPCSASVQASTSHADDVALTEPAPSSEQASRGTDSGKGIDDPSGGAADPGAATGSTKAASSESGMGATSRYGHADKSDGFAAGRAGREDGAQSVEVKRSCFLALVKKHFKGGIKPPFNVSARRAAGFPDNWYMSKS